jgi:hypothetical protein
MKPQDIVKLRLSNQQLSTSKFKKPEEIISWLVAMQAQEFTMAKWAIGLRLPDTTDKAVQLAFDQGKILRTHILRPTWHFVAPQDIRWMLSISAPRVHALNAYYYRKYELDTAVFKRTNNVLIKQLRGGKFLTRAALNKSLADAKIKADALRLVYIFMQAELEGIICSGPRNGKQFTYALLDERVPASKVAHPEEVLLELTKRYFTSRGPATVQDFVWWSGLTTKQANTGIAMLGDNFIHDRFENQDFILNSSSPKKGKTNGTFLMPDYDEYGISYKNRRALIEKSKEGKKNLKTVSPYNHLLVVDGIISGTWKPSINNTGDVEVTPFLSIPKTKQKAIDHAIKKYNRFFAD